MSTLLERVRSALAPHYAVERMLGAGGMGVVFLARDTRLDRLVAIKVLRPEVATAVAVERFSREAKTLANLHHPSVVRVFHAGEAGGISYYVMEYLGADTLKDRLERTALSARQVRTLGRALLDALSAAHSRAIVHRDIKPANLFLSGDRPVLADFGIARAEEDTTLTDTGQRIGTARYMAPEQHAGQPATPRSDIYAVGMVLYESCTRRHWVPFTPPEKGNWSSIPRSLGQPLRKALAVSPTDRWATAAEFRAALADRPRRALVAVAAAAALAAASAWILIRPDVPRDNQPPPTLHRARLSLAPFGGGDAGLARQLASHVATQLEWFRRWEFVWSDPNSVGADHPTSPAELQAEGELHRRNGTTSLQLSIRAGARLQHVLDIAGDPHNPVGWGRAIADSIVRSIFPQYIDEFRYYAERTSRNAQAQEALHSGQAAFRADAWEEAELAFSRALDSDPGFAQAAWNLALIRKWNRDSSHMLILRRLYDRQRDDLPPLQRLLTEAELTPDLHLRVERFGEALRRYPLSTDAQLLYGNELYHRGPLVGIPLDSALAVLEAIGRRESFSTARVHAALGHIRLGHRAQAEGQLARLIPLPAGSDAEARLRADLLQYAFDERFRPLQGRMKRALLRFTAGPELVEGLFRFARLANFFDVPGAQIALGRILETKGTGIRERASGAEAQALGLLLSGQTREGLSKLDQAAALLRSPEAEFQALEWRVMLPLVGLPGPGDTERQRARAALAGTSGPFAARAAWVSALAAMEDRDTSAALRWRQTLAVQASTNLRYGPLLRLLDAVRAGADNDPARALALSDSIAPYDPGGIGSDPFARAVLYLRRAEWQRLTGAGNAADHTLLFTQAWDTHEWPQREAQSGEVDVVVGALARLRRAAVAASAGRDADASILATRVCEIWKAAGPEYQALRRQARTLAGGRCG
jgi:serine/threonine protein kinase